MESRSDKRDITMWGRALSADLYSSSSGGLVVLLPFCIWLDGLLPAGGMNLARGTLLDRIG